MTLPKCTSWRGHKFEGRFSYGGAGGFKHGTFQGSAAQCETMLRAVQSKTYERDICVRCGLTVERHPAPKPPETQA